MGEGDNAPIGGGYMPLYAPQMPFIFVYIIYIIYRYRSHNGLGRRQKKSIYGYMTKCQSDYVSLSVTCNM